MAAGGLDVVSPHDLGGAAGDGQALRGGARAPQRPRTGRAVYPRRHRPRRRGHPPEAPDHRQEAARRDVEAVTVLSLHPGPPLGPRRREIHRCRALWHRPPNQGAYR